MNSPVTIDSQLVLNQFREAGYAVRFEPTDRVHRVWLPIIENGAVRWHNGALVGLIVIRLCPSDLEPRIMYAEFAGRVYPWFGRDRNSTEYLQSIAALIAQIEEEAL